MTNAYTTPTPPPPRPPDTRPLRKRKRVWLGGAGLLLAGALITTPSGNDQQPVEAKTQPTTTVTATVTTTPAPAPTVTVTAPNPAPTVTVTVTTTAEAADPYDAPDDPAPCSITSNSGNCYSAGQFCRKADHGATTTNANGTPIKCTYRSNAWRWTYA